MIKQLFIGSVLAASVSAAWAWDGAEMSLHADDGLVAVRDTVAPEGNGDVMTTVEVQPEFPGGVNALMDYLSQQLKYPASAQTAGIEGRVMVAFLVMKDGSVTDAKVVKSVHEDLDKEALRVVGTMPKWSPGLVKGEPVNVRFTLPIVFRLKRNDGNGPKPGAGGQRPAMGGQRPGMGGGFPGFQRNTAVFGVYKKTKNYNGNDLYMFGVKDKMRQVFKVSLVTAVQTKNEVLMQTITEKVFNSSGTFEEALKKYRKSLDEAKIEEAKYSTTIDITEYATKPNGVVGIEYRCLANVTDFRKLPDCAYFLFDTNTNSVVTLDRLVSPALNQHLKSQGIETEKSTNIYVKDQSLVAITPQSVITMDGIKLKANLSEFALEIIGM